MILSVLEEVKAAEEKAASLKEQAKADAVNSLKAAEKTAREDAEKIVADARKKAAEIVKDSENAAAKATEKYASLLKDEKDKFTVIAKTNRASAVDYAVSLLN